MQGLWWLEVANAFQMAIRRKRITVAFRDSALAKLTAMPIVADSDTHAQAWSATLRLSERFGLTVYDAAYLKLAQRRGLPLGTLDRELRTAAPAIGVALFGMAV